jgi:uncharacterized surface protein with fasciclin (FAS1) repeats
MALSACNSSPKSTPISTAAPSEPADNMPPIDETNIVSLAVGSKDHTTLVKALKAADYVPSVANTGPLTVFAPTNEAFAKLPAGTLDSLLLPGKADELREILKYHVTTSGYSLASFKDGQTLAMANGRKVTIHVQDGKVRVNDANIIASIPASNGMLHIIDAVLLPPSQ